MEEIFKRTNSFSLELDEIIDQRNFLPVQKQYSGLCLCLSQCQTLIFGADAQRKIEGCKRELKSTTQVATERQRMLKEVRD